MKLRSWDVYLNGRFVSMVFYDEVMGEGEVLADLINKGYSPLIRVFKGW